MDTQVPAAPANMGEGFEVREVQANGFTFSCCFAGVGGEAGNVVLLHGFPETCKIFKPLMKELSRGGYCCLAYNQRGYSRGAAPESKADYHYDHLRDDLFAVAKAVDFCSFHLIGHDHGAVLGWYAVASERGREHVLSFTSLSIPHLDAFSEGLFGENADRQQQMASQYFTFFVLENSASLCGSLLARTAGRFAGFGSARAFQKALWWYNGVFDAGLLAFPPTFSARTLLMKGFVVHASFRCLYGGTPNSGVAQTKAVGKITMPVLYMCGAQDTFIFGNRPFALETKEYCIGGYRYLKVPGGHDLAHAGSSGFQEVSSAILSHLAAATSADAAAEAACHGRAG